MTSLAETPGYRAKDCMYFLLCITSATASWNKSCYLSSSSVCPPVFEVLCIDGKPSDTPSSIEPTRGKKEHYS